MVAIDIRHMHVDEGHAGGGRGDIGQKVSRPRPRAFGADDQIEVPGDAVTRMDPKFAAGQGIDALNPGLPKNLVSR